MYNNCSYNCMPVPGHETSLDSTLNLARAGNLERELNYFRASYTQSVISYKMALSYTNIFSNVFGNLNYSKLELYISKNIITNSVSLEYLSRRQPYSITADYNSLFITSGIIHSSDMFLMPSRPQQEFVETITPHLKRKIEQIFSLTAGFNLPEEVFLSVLSENELEREHRKHSRHWSRNIQGFAINRKHLNDFSSVFVKQNPLDALLLTIGHEIGHCLSISKENKILEEAKAFAFELAWLKTIHKFDIMNLAKSMNISLLNPAANGVHDVALGFVRSHLSSNEPIEVFKKIVNDEIKF